MNKISAISLTCLLLCAAFAPAVATPTPSWQWANPTPQGNNLNASVTGNGVSVAVGGGGTIYSNAGGNWVAQTSPTINNLFAITYGGSVFAAVGQAGTIVTSTNGSTWSLITGTDPTQTLTCISYGNGTFVAAGTNGTVYTSPDGVNWTKDSIGSHNGSVTTSVAFGQGLFVAIVHVPGNPSTIQIYNSTNGTAWNPETIANFPTDPPVLLSFNGTTFVALGLNIQGAAGGSIMTSPDGKTWTIQAPLSPAGAFPISITAAGATFVVMLQSGEVASAATTPILIETSADGATWKTQQNNNLPDIWSKPIPKQLSLSGGSYLTVGASAYIATSQDLITWTSQSVATSVTYAHLRGVHWFGSPSRGQFFAVGDADTVITSPDGVKWTNLDIGASRPPSQQGNLREIAYNGSLYVAVGSNGVVLTSSDGRNWNTTVISPAVPPGTIFQGLVWGDKLFVAVGTSGAIYTSPDGFTWNAQKSGTQDNLWGVAWTGSSFVVVSDSTTDSIRILTSSNGTSWTSVPFTLSSFPFISLYGIHWNGSELIVAGGAATSSGQLSALIATSTDGNTWTIRPAADISDILTDATLNGSGSNAYAAVSQSSGDIYTSSDGQNWTAQIPTIQDSGMQNLAANCGTRVATGYAGVILYSIAQPPTPTNGSVSTKQDMKVSGNLQACGGVLTFAVDQPVHGSVTLTNEATGVFTYTPAKGYSGTDSFTFTAANTAGTSIPATETVTVSATGSPPTASNGSISTPENTAVSGMLQASGGPLSFHIATQPAYGTVTLTNAPTGTFTYTPASGFTGTDSFTFTASNNSGTSQAATETVTVTASGGGGGGGGGGGTLGYLSLAILTIAAVGLRQRRR